MSNEKKHLVSRTGIPQSPTTSNKYYGLLLQNKATNQLALIDTKRMDMVRIPYTQNYQISYKDLKVDIAGKVSIGPAETMMLDYIIFVHTQQPNHDNVLTVTIPTKQYMSDRGIKDAKTARNFLKREKDILRAIHYDFNGKDNHNPQEQSSSVNLFSSTYWARTGAVFILTPEFNEQLTQRSSPMPLPKALFQLHPKRDENAYQIGRYLALNKWTNYGQERTGKVRIATILDHCTSIPSYEHVMKHGKHVRQQIMEKFFRAVEQLALLGIIEYKIIDQNGNEFNYDAPYSEFIKGFVQIIRWPYYLDDYARSFADKRSKHRKQARQRKARNRRK